MIVNKKNKTYQMRSDAPNYNWLKSDDWCVVADDSELANKIIRLFPRFNLIVDENNNVVDVVELAKTQEELIQEHMYAIKAELTELDNSINRATEDLYEASNITPYESVQEVINRKKELREELKTL